MHQGRTESAGKARQTSPRSLYPHSLDGDTSHSQCFLCVPAILIFAQNSVTWSHHYFLLITKVSCRSL